MSDKNLITLCIPTFNREETVSLLIQDLIKKEVNDSVNILIIDDGSDDDTFNKLSEYKNKSNLKIIQNPKNRGFAQTFIRCLEECETEYLVLCTDDEIIVSESLPELDKTIKLSKADFISTKFISEYGGREHKKRSKLKLKDIWKAGKHIPGLVFKRSSALSACGKLIDQLDRENAIAFFFPQIYLLLIMQVSGMLLIKAPIIISAKNPGGSKASQILSPSGETYASLSTVIDRFTAFNELYLSLLEDQDFYEFHNEIKLLKIKHERSFLKMIESAIYFEDPNLLMVFRKSIMHRFFSLKLIFKAIKKRINF